MYRVERRVGQLVEIAIWSPVSLEEAIAWGRDHDAVIDATRGRYVCFVDLRGARVFPPDVVDAYVATMKDEPRLLRTGTLLPLSAVVALQINRMIREAAHPERRAFSEAAPLASWLGERLEPLERARLDALLRAPPPQA
ncbi:MAG: hypothetical protein H6713_30035 [Myxococcales bacterium]|nr:hypothetical protein [Myxococcales bacterium]MCB9754204.1 hypothetical protein [Myxococcales bacterium]